MPHASDAKEIFVEIATGSADTAETVFQKLQERGIGINSLTLATKALFEIESHLSMITLGIFIS